MSAANPYYRPLAGVHLTIILVPAILLAYELRSQRNDLAAIRVYQRRLKDLVIVSGAAVVLPLARTLFTVNAVAGEILRSIQGNQILTTVVSIAFQLLRSLQPAEKLLVAIQKRCVGVMVYCLSQLAVRGNLLKLLC